MNDSPRTIGQVIGLLLFVGTAGIPGMHLAGFWGGTRWPVFAFLPIAAAGGLAGGALMARSHRIAGAFGGFIAAPLGLIAIYFYARNRQSIHTAEVVLVQAIASLPGFGIYFLGRLLTDALFPGPALDEDEPRPRKRRRRTDEDEDEEPRPRSRRRRTDEDDDEEPRPRSRRRRTDEDDDEDDDEPRPKRRRRDDEDDDERPRRRRRDEDE